MTVRKKASSSARTASTKAKATTRPAAKKASKSAKVMKRSAAPKATAQKMTSGSTLKLPSKVITEKQTKAQIYAEIAEITQVSKSEVKYVLTALRNVIERHLKNKGSGNLTLPELGIKVRRIQKKATKARMGRNPFTGEEIQIPAKPARKSVKVSALKTLKAIIEA
jgi:nucleoid DNA-binding protein